MQVRVSGLALFLTSLAVNVLAQAPAQRPYDGIQAGLDAFQLAEEKRQANIAHQLYLNDQLKYWSGLPTSRGETIYYGPAGAGYPGYGSATPILPPASMEYTYAYGRRYWGQTRGRVFAQSLTVFEPWPYVPGDIYGYTYYPPLRQPIGQQQTQTGPNRWESHPVYDPPLPDFRPLPPVASPLLDKTPYATPPRLRESFEHFHLPPNLPQLSRILVLKPLLTRRNLLP